MADRAGGGLTCFFHPEPPPSPIPKINTLHPKPYTRNPSPETLRPKLYTLHPTPYTLGLDFPTPLPPPPPNRTLLTFMGVNDPKIRVERQTLLQGTWVGACVWLSALSQAHLGGSKGCRMADREGGGWGWCCRAEPPSLPNPTPNTLQPQP